MENKILGFTLSLALLGAAASVQAQTYTTLDNPAGTGGTTAYGISGNNIVGWYANSSGWQLGFLYNGSTYTTLTDPLSVNTTMYGPVPNGNYAYGISGNNTVGLYYWNAPVNGVNGYSGFLYNGSTYTTLSDPLSVSTSAQGIDGNNIVGYYNDSSFNNYGFLYNGSTYTTLADPLGTKTYAYGISGNNIVGLYMDSSFNHYGFLYNIGAGTYTTLADPLGVYGTVAQGISGNNIVGTYFDSTGMAHGFLYNGSTYTTVDDPLGVKGTEVLGVDGNNVVGTYFDSSDVPHGFETSVEPAPEPTTLALAGLGSLSLLLFHRRK